MLLQQPKKTPYVHVFKISTGEEIITRVVSEDDKEYMIEKPLQLAMGQQGFQFVPFMVMTDAGKPQSLKKDKIVSDASPSPKTESQYESITTGIALPQKSSIITN